MAFFASLWAISAEANVEDLQERLRAASNDPEVDFEALVTEAREGGVKEAYILQATVFKKLARRDIDGSLETIDSLLEVAEDLSFGPSETFLSKRQIVGFASALRAFQAYEQNNYEEFENQASKAFLDAPSYVEAFGLLSLLTEMRASEARDLAMADLRIPMDLEIASVDGESRTLQGWLGGNQALLIDFWASWCGPCIMLMPQLKAKAEALADQGVLVVGMNTDKGNNQLELAKKIQDQHEMQSVTWLLEPKTAPLGSLLMINSIPRMILVGEDGSVLYNGHPMDPTLKQALAKLNVTLPEGDIAAR